VIHDSMPYDPIQYQDQDQGHGGPKVSKMAIFKTCLKVVMRVIKFKRLTVNYDTPQV